MLHAQWKCISVSSHHWNFLHLTRPRDFSLTGAKMWCEVALLLPEKKKKLMKGLWSVRPSVGECTQSLRLKPVNSALLNGLLVAHPAVCLETLGDPRQKGAIKKKEILLLGPSDLGVMTPLQSRHLWKALIVWCFGCIYGFCPLVSTCLLIAQSVLSFKEKIKGLHVIFFCHRRKPSKQNLKGHLA